ncbi:MAG: TIGR03790 family protein [Deltaproteobacteria bacterium]|nr:MAG: TIGR03790 family protein [Deltaproteobacteria bacterium]
MGNSRERSRRSHGGRRGRESPPATGFVTSPCGSLRGVGCGMVAALLLLACGRGVAPAGDTGAPPCALLGPLPDGDRLTPGSTVDLSIEVDPEAMLSATVTAGSVTVEGGAAGTAVVRWTLPLEVGLHVDEPEELQVTASAAGCPDETASRVYTVGFSEAERVVVVYNPSVDGSREVAVSYAALHGVSDDRLCAVDTAADATLDGADFPEFVDAVRSCVDAAGPQVHVIVPVYGVPYRVTGRIDDISGSGSKATVSIDSLLFMLDDAVDATEATYNPAWQHGDSMAGEYDPYLPWGLLRLYEDDPLYQVARIDGVDADAALELIDRTAEAMELAAAGQLTGTVYVDGRYGDTPPETDSFGSYESGEWNMWGTRRVFEELGWYPVVWDGNSEEFGTPPAPESCPDALYYAGWYSYANYNDAFTWVPGAIGGHLDSCSACDIRGDRDWSAVALQRGITATFGAVSEPYVAGMPEYDQFFLYLTQGASFGEAAYESTRLARWMMVWVGDPLYRPYGGAARSGDGGPRRSPGRASG